MEIVKNVNTINKEESQSYIVFTNSIFRNLMLMELAGIVKE